MFKGIYLGSYKAFHKNHDIVYQDINGERDLDGDMLTIDLKPYDYIIATPPCNWWSRANYRKEESVYALKTKLLLPCILYKLILTNKPFIVENVLNSIQFKNYQLDNLPGVRMVKIGRHTYWSNIEFKYDDIIQKPKTIIENGKKKWLSSQHLGRKDRQGTDEVHEVIERFINEVESWQHH